MKKTFLIAFLIIFSTQYTQAQFHYILTSLPDSAEVKLNGELKGHTPYKLKFFWRNAKDGKLAISLHRDGYQAWSDTITKKPMSWDQRKRVHLKLDFPYLDLDKSPLIAFDKLTAEFQDGEIIGKKVFFKKEVEQLKWKGSIKIGDESFTNQFYEIATKMGLNTSVSEKAKLFSEDQKGRKQLPRYIIGAEIIDYSVNYHQLKGKDYGDGDVKGETKISFKWKVLDKKNGKIVLIKENTVKVLFRQEVYQNISNHALVFEKALIDFFKDEKFIALLNDGIGEESITEEVAEASATLIEKFDNPDFSSISEMIKDINQSCVTVITDGGHGSGVLIDQKGLILSAYHVVDGVNKIDVKFSNGLTLEAEILSFDKFNDLVLLGIPGKGYHAAPIKWEMEKLSLGEEVLTIGTPAELELGQSISRGIVSGNREHDGNIFVQLDMAVSPGNSGGPLLNNKGEVVGVVQRKLIGNGIEGIGFAIPIPKVIEALNLEPID